MAAKKTRSKSTKKTAAKRKATTKKRPAKKRPAKKKAAAKKPAAKKKAAAKPKRAKRASASDARVDQIQRLIDVMVDAGAVEVELEEAGSKLRVRLKDDSPSVVSLAAPHAAPVAAAPAPAVAAPAPAAPAPAAAAAEPEPANGTQFTSPMVGTFYASPSPDAEVFVRVGDRVTEDTTLCILEAMKVMNEIKAELSGSIVEVLVQNGQPVEYGQPLFVIEVD